MRKIEAGTLDKKDAADWIAPQPGGHGAVRALCDFILAAQDPTHDQPYLNR